MSTFWLLLSQKIPLILWQLLFLCGLMLVIAGYSFTKKRLRFGIMGAGCFLVFMATFFLTCYAYVYTCCWIQIKKPVILYAGPAKQYHNIGKIEGDELVCINGDCREWKCLQAKVCNGWAYLL